MRGAPGRARLAALATALCVAGAGCNRDPVKGASPTPVRIEVARSVGVEESSEYLATLKSRASAVIKPEVEGRITGIFVRSGDRVAAGTSLMQIDPSKQQATLKSQEDTRAARLAALEYAKQQHERVTRLSTEGVASRQDLDQATSALNAADAELKALDAQVREQQVQLHYYRVDAPTAGVVGDVPVRVGDRVTVDTVLTTLDLPSALEAYVSVPVERAAQLRLGLPLEILDSAGQLITRTTITFVSPQVEDEMQTILVKGRVEGAAGLRPDQFIRARVIWQTHDGPVVPVLAVSRISGQYFAFVAEGKDGSLVARQRQLRLGEILGGDYVVLDGIKPGDRVIVSGVQFLVDGAPVTPQS